jgi:anti-sigma factor RsiW
MTCREADDLLDDYVDGTLAEAQFQEVELHLASCESCRKAERGLRRLLAEAAALPREKSPVRDLWPEIRQQIGPRATFAAWRPLAIAASLVLAVAAGYFLRGAPTPATTLGPSQPVGRPVSVSSPALAQAEDDYVRAADALWAALHERRDAYSPETIESVEKNLAVIDTALAEVRAALQRDPENPELTRMLAATHRKKVDVLRRVVKLTTTL